MADGDLTSLSNDWLHSPETLGKRFYFEDYTSASSAAKKIDEMSTIMDRQVNMNFDHKGIDGVHMDLELLTGKDEKLTQKDFDAARAIDMLLLPDQIVMSNYSYNLAEESIAKYPASPRGSSKLLKIDESGDTFYYDNFSHVFADMVKNCHLVFNESRVLEARLFVLGESGENIEVMILDLGVVNVKSKSSDVELRAMIRTSSVKENHIFHESGGHGSIEVLKVEGIWQEDEKSQGNGVECIIRIDSDSPLQSYLQEAGKVPIPPYLNREAEDADVEAYNNLYSNVEKAGSVAAPTAGLHFTEELLTKIGDENCSYLTLHVGAGTFKPVVAEDARDHEMHAEAFAVPVLEVKRIIRALEEKKPLVVVGTTSCRTLESLFWCGVKRIRGLENDSEALYLDQLEWLPLSVGSGHDISRIDALKALVEGLEDSEILSGRTSLMICPPIYDFKVVDHLVTNFHAPDSTLMLLVASFLKDSEGVKIRRAYENAQERGYRFLSYGDVCMFSKPSPSLR